MPYTLLVLVLFLSNCLKPILQSPGSTSDQPGADSTVTVSDTTTTSFEPNGAPLKNMFGVNAFEWDFLQNPADMNNHDAIYEANMAVIKSFGAVRHYMDWVKLEHQQGYYTYNPTYDGSWNYDLIYTRCKQEGITVLSDLKNCPSWLKSTYPSGQQDDENVPVPYGSDLNSPSSYVLQAKAAFQFAARYGYNPAVSKSLLSVDTRARWANDKINEVKVGMSLIKYIECDNERDKWWKGPQTKQTPEQYAANMSAFYDGHKATLGKNAGVKTADPNMNVVMGGLATCDTNFVIRMINWCRTNRGYKADGSVNLCFDVINYHFYSNDGDILTHRQATTGVAPELSDAAKIADAFVRLGKQYKIPVWVTESGYDINAGSIQRAPAIGNKPALITQADWNLRSALLYMRHGIQRLFYYMLFDAAANNSTQYATSGLAENAKRRPTADYILQTGKLMGDYTYNSTISNDPLVDKYVSGSKVIYVLTVPDQKNRTSSYTLDMGDKTVNANIYSLKVGADAMAKTAVSPVQGKLTVSVSETPVFVEAITQ